MNTAFYARINGCEESWAAEKTCGNNVSSPDAPLESCSLASATYPTGRIIHGKISTPFSELIFLRTPLYLHEMWLFLFSNFFFLFIFLYFIHTSSPIQLERHRMARDGVDGMLWHGVVWNGMVWCDGSRTPCNCSLRNVSMIIYSNVERKSTTDTTLHAGRFCPFSLLVEKIGRRTASVHLATSSKWWTTNTVLLSVVYQRYTRKCISHYLVVIFQQTNC